MAGRAKENLPGGSLKYLFVYLKDFKIRIFKCSYRTTEATDTNTTATTTATTTTATTPRRTAKQTRTHN